MTRSRSLAARALLTLSMLAPLAACSFGPAQTSDDREAVADCKQESDRIYAARNRDQLSERDSSDTPFSGNNLPYNPSAGLGDEFQRDQFLDTCLAHSAAGDAVIPGPASGPTQASPSKATP
jgi:hypothetical protein